MIEELIELKESQIKEMVDIEMNLFRLELANACVPKKERQGTAKAVEDYREKRWKRALKAAKGDASKAELIYDEISVS